MSTTQWRTMLQKIWASLPATYWCSRIVEELSYLLELSESRGRSLDAAVGEGVLLLKQRAERDQAVTPATVREIEALLADLSAEAKSLKMICTANAHIDMNWMWGYQETVALTVDTVRTVLTLMEEYPKFVYTQPQASVYAILEQYAPDLLAEVRRRVQEGRWEAPVSGWVEQDKNMIATESEARHLLYAKRYIADLLDIPRVQLDVEFVPDTFGHSRHIPELLADGGIKYYYHCRGHEGPHLFRWRAPSGREVLAYREPGWYNLNIEYNMARSVPGFCASHGIDTALYIYGVGDHGGGPTRRDLERFQDMETWPLYPTLVHGSVRSFFLTLEAHREKLPVVQEELNCVFTGCYTSQSRIKRANRYGEAKLYDAEILDVMAHAWDPAHKTLDPEHSWRKVLFNQFHDILPGSGTVETREYAMGEFQTAMAWTETTAKRAMQCIASGIAGGKKALPEVGVGIFTDDSRGYGVSGTGFVGDRRHFMLANTTPMERSELTELMIWDWQYAPEEIRITDEQGETVPWQLIGTGTLFWGHNYVQILLPAKVPAMGYSVCCVSRAVPDRIHVPVNREPRRDTFSDGDFVLENEKIRAVFQRETMQCVSLIHKASGKEMLDPDKPACGLELVTEDPVHGMAAWRIGPAAKIVKLNETEPVFVYDICGGPLRQRLGYYLCFGRSRVDVTLSLDQGSDRLDIALKVDWHELGNPAVGIPLLRMAVPVGYAHQTYRYLTAGGTVDRPAVAYDVPSLGLGCAVAGEGRSLAVLSDCKYGFRGWDGAMYLTLLRSPFAPDPCPDQGLHHMKAALMPVSAEPLALMEASMAHMHPLMSCVVPAEEEVLTGKTASLLTLEGAFLAAMKRAEDGDGLILRIFNPKETQSDVEIRFCRTVERAYITDVCEQTKREIPCQGDTLRLTLDANCVCSLAVIMEED